MLGQGAVIWAMLLQVAPSAALPPADEVVVTAERLRRLRLSLAIPAGKLRTCAVKVSSGDARIDTVACEAARACVEGGVQAAEPLADCINTHIAEFVDKRAAAAAAR